MTKSDTWEAVIGLEIHVQLATQSKSFSPSAVVFAAEENNLTDPVVLGLPGTLPVYNRRALDLAIRLGLACGCDIAPQSRFARKHYFYPDLPKGYQISQYDEPLCVGGAIDYWVDHEPFQLALTRIHVEEDAGKNLHRGARSLVDLNRAGVALCEIVSEPELHSATHAAAVLRSLRALVRWLGVGDGDMEKGQMRCDANVSIRRQGDNQLGTRTELKNINSFRFVEQAITAEIARQISIAEDGGAIVSETRLWDADAGRSRSMRGKEEAEDYRYFPDPDLPPLRIDADVVAAARADLGELPAMARKRYQRYGLGADAITTLVTDHGLSTYYDAAVTQTGEEHASTVANWLITDVQGEWHRRGLSVEDSPVTAEQLAELVLLVASATISGKIAKSVLDKMFATGEKPSVIVENEGLTQLSEPSAISALVADVLQANSKQVEQYRAGKESLLGYFVGQVMKASQGKANPKMVNEILRAKLKGQ